MKNIAVALLIATLAISTSVAQDNTNDTNGELIVAQQNKSNELEQLNNDELFKKGNGHYMAEQYAEAIKAYEAIVLRGYVSEELYFNLGNAYYKTGNIPKAILMFERAQLLDPTDKDISFNIALCNQFVVDKIDPLPRPFFVEWYHALVNINSVDEWARVSLIAFIGMLLLILGFVFTPSSLLKKLAFSFGIIFLLLAIFTWVFAAQQKRKLLDHKSAIIFTPTVTVKGSPDESGHALFVIHEGLKVDILETIGDWHKIRLIDGNIGWVQKRSTGTNLVHLLFRQ